MKDNYKYKYDWAIFTASYLLLAKLACQELLDKRKYKHSKSSLGYYPYNPSDLLIPILYNVKHGIEIFIKTMSIFAYKDYNGSDHDILKLFEETHSKILEIDFKPRISGSGDIITQKGIDDIPNELEKLREYVIYFYHLEFLKSKVKRNNLIMDIKNDIFRYPANKASFEVHWGALLDSGTDIVDVDDLYNMIEGLYELFSCLGYKLAILSHAVYAPIDLPDTP